MDELLFLKILKERNRLREEVKRLKRGLAHIMNEYEAYRRVSEMRIKERGQKEKENLLKELFVLLEDIDRLLGVVEEGEVPADLKEGTQSIKRKIDHTLKVLGVEKLIPKVGDPFDPSYMEALSVVADDKLPSGSVGMVYEPGWKYKGKLLKPARVAVVK